MKFKHSLTPYTKIKITESLKYKARPPELLEEGIGKIFSDINCSNVYLGHSPKAKQINRWYLIKIISLCIVNESINKKTTYRLGENICKP